MAPYNGDSDAGEVPCTKTIRTSSFSHRVPAMRQTDRPVQIIYAIERRQISRTDAARALSPIECRILPQSGSRTFFDASAAPSESNVIFALVAPSQRRFRSHFAQTYHNIPIDVRCFSQQHVHSRFSWTLVSSSMRSGAIHGLFP